VNIRASLSGLQGWLLKGKQIIISIITAEQMKVYFLQPDIRQLSVLIFALTLSSLLLTSCGSSSDISGDQLEAGFISPPDDARPLVWWHWMNGNITKAGIRSDLEWMHRNGIGGFQTFDIGDFPQIVEKRLVYMDPEWKDAFRFAVFLADSLHMETGIAASPGFSESGGPWVEPGQAMKKYVWSDTTIKGGVPFSGVLPHPPAITGPFQNIGIVPRASLGPERQVTIPEYYADAAVVAFSIPEGQWSMRELNPVVTSSGGNFTLDQLTDGDLVKSVILPAAPPGDKAWIQFEFESPVTVQSMTLVDGGGGRGPGMGSGSGNKTLEFSNDGSSFTPVTELSGGRATEKTISFAPVTGKYLRYSVRSPQATPASAPRQSSPGSPGLGMFGGTAATSGTQVCELVLNTDARVSRFEDKAAFSAVTSSELAISPTPETDSPISKTDVIELTSLMQPDGTLEWTPPAGKWVILRFGYSLIGTMNHPASPEATGLEVDKLSRDYVRGYFTTYLDMYEEASGGLMGQKGLKYVLNDSWEAGTQNWTDNMIAEFQNRRGYSIIPWMPVLAGRIVESAGASDRFLWDFRRTLEEMVAEYHYDELTDILRERGMGRYSESHEGGRALIADGMEVKRNADIPMSATWVSGGMGGGSNNISTRHQADVRESASVSHLYGKKYIAAESLTSWGPAWGYSPDMLKPTADGEFASGLNRIVIHASPHNPVDDKIPGTSLGPFGQMFTRHETWAEQAIAWTDYLARSSYMLQQGTFVADIAYMYGEGNNITALFGQDLPDVPAGYEYDFVNADALINLFSVNKGKLITPSGMSYKLLALDESTSRMTLPVLKKIRELVSQGAMISGNKPVSSPGLGDNPEEFNAIADELWPDQTGEKATGRGRVFAGYSIGEVMNMLNINQDFTYTDTQDDQELLYVHRRLGNIDIYWVNNRLGRNVDTEATFRVDGKIPEIWHPDSGETERVSYTIGEGTTRIPLYMEPNDAYFVVFRKKSDKVSESIPRPQKKVLYTVEAPWTVQFQEGRGAPSLVAFDALSPWNENSDEGIKYFSGTGTYTKTVNAPAEWFTEGSGLLLNLGDVKNLAEVKVNGKPLGIAWKNPFEVDITNSLREGENELEIKVINLWVNRLIGDEQPENTKKYTYTGFEFYNADAPLVPSGLLGPVTIVGLSYDKNEEL